MLEAYLEWCDWALEMIDTWERAPGERRDIAVEELRRWSRAGSLWNAAEIDPPRNV
ncbi:hypothetical protein [Ilumatobacter sp.]|uniref:hypothetical protein n=1 Tax=Ilumatobacter sp. TaxID=1967498 RepID=UPI003AF6DF9A